MADIYPTVVTKNDFALNGQKNIFFLETSKPNDFDQIVRWVDNRWVRSNPPKIFKPLQLCAVESAAYSHPGHNTFVVLLFYDKVMFNVCVSIIN